MSVSHNHHDPSNAGRLAMSGVSGNQMTRRHFVCGFAQSALAANVASLTGSMAFAATDKRVIVGAHPWVYAATEPKHDITPVLDRIFADMSYAGMDGIELMHTALRPDGAVQHIAALSEQYKLPVIGSSFGGAMWDRGRHNEVFKGAERVITRLAKLGGKTLGTSVGSAGRKKTPDDLDAQAELLRKIMAVCKDNGVVLNLHNHTYEVKDDMHDLQGTLARIPDVKLGPDLDWLVQADVDPVEFLLKFGERIVFLHLRDQKADKTWVEAMGEGDMNYRAVGHALRQINFTGHAVIELAHPRGMKRTRPLRESLAISRRYVRDRLGY